MADEIPTRYGSAPMPAAPFALAEWTEFCSWLYLPVHLAGPASPVVLPPNLAHLRPIVDVARLDAVDLGRDPSRDYVYVTAKRGFATPGNPLNRPGWHTDGFGTEDLNYVWWSNFPSRFAVHEFEGISENHHRSMAQFERQAVANHVVEDRVLYRLDPFCVHTTPEVLTPGGMRSFLKVSISRHRYNLVGNSHNHGLDYLWEMHPRDVARNDPAQYGRDYFEAAENQEE